MSQNFFKRELVPSKNVISFEKRFKAVFFDFDGTLTVNAIPMHDYYNPTPSTALENFGGEQRLQQLKLMLEEIKQTGCEIYCLTFSTKASVKPQLDLVRLDRFFKSRRIVGSEDPFLRNGCRLNKGFFFFVPN